MPQSGALKGEAIVRYAEPLITQHMGASGSPLFQKGENR
jgi:hypothetical protein